MMERWEGNIELDSYLPKGGLWSVNFEMIFGVFKFFQKTNERILINTMTTCFRSVLEEIEDTKNHFEII